MNYIKQLTSAMVLFTDDDRLNTAHVSLYLALFQLWNINRFRNPISINRTEVMKISKIGSRVTYHKCIKDLDNWSYLKYEPSHNPLKGSRVYMFNFETTPEHAVSQPSEQLLGQVVGPSLNNLNSKKKSKQIKTRGSDQLSKSETRTGSSNSRVSKTSFAKPSIDEVKDFFENKMEAEKFFNYYTSNGWKVGGRTPMKDWKAAARNWKIKANEISNGNGQVQKRDNLHTIENKDYNIPL